MSAERLDISIKTCSTRDGHWCSFGNHGRRPQGEFVFIEKVDGEWPEWAYSTVHQGDSVFEPGAILDALSDHRARTP